MIGIYKITSPSGKIYIGQSINIERRFKDYIALNLPNQIKLLNSFNKYGVDNHIFKVIEECELKLLNNRERHWQDYYDVLSQNGLNCKLTTSDSKTGKRSKESIEKMRQTLFENPPMLGKTHSQQTKDKISNSKLGGTPWNKGVPLTDLEKGVNHHNYGIKRSNEYKKNVGDRMRGTVQSEDTISKRVEKLKKIILDTSFCNYTSVA